MKPQVQEQEQVAVAEAEETVHVPMYHVILMDDDDHTFDYVVEMLVRIFNHEVEKAAYMTYLVDHQGWVIVDTTHKDRAELKRDQIHAYGKDWRLAQCKGSMTAVVEPAFD
jgi:ATP-dependent Clp protease adaptor protein ClpS